MQEHGGRGHATGEWKRKPEAPAEIAPPGHVGYSAAMRMAGPSSGT